MHSFSAIAARGLSSPIRNLGKRHALILGVFFFLFTFAAFGQQATIVGTITDPSGGLVPNVTIAITHTDTGTVHVFSTNEAGQYVAPDLQIGHYNVKASASGFKASEQKDIVLNVGDRIRIDFQMQLGTATETVTVEAAAIHVQTESGEASNVITGQQITQLATNGRSLYELFALAPGPPAIRPVACSLPR